MQKVNHLQRVCPAAQDGLRVFEEQLRDCFLPALTGQTYLSEEFRSLLLLPTKLGGVGILPPSLRSGPSLHASRSSTRHLVDAQLGRIEDFDLLLHKELGKEGRAELAARTSDLCATRRIELDAHLPESIPTARSRLDLTWLPDHLKPESCWLSQLPLFHKGFALTAIEFRDGLALRYGYEPPDVPALCTCDDSTPFSRAHAFACRKGGHIVARHNSIQRALDNIAAAAFPKKVRNEPWIRRPSDGEPTGLRADLGIANFDDTDGRDMLLDVRITDMDGQSNLKIGAPRAILAKHEAEKLRKYRLPVANAGATFKPFVMGADGTLGLQAAEIMMVMAKNLANKEWKLRDQLHLTGPYCWIYNRLSFAIIRASSSCMRGYRRTDFAPMVYYDYVYWRPSIGV